MQPCPRRTTCGTKPPNAPTRRPQLISNGPWFVASVAQREHKHLTRPLPRNELKRACFVMLREPVERFLSCVDYRFYKWPQNGPWRERTRVSEQLSPTPDALMSCRTRPGVLTRRWFR